jgi:hypothetical protein
MAHHDAFHMTLNVEGMAHHNFLYIKTHPRNIYPLEKISKVTAPDFCYFLKLTLLHHLLYIFLFFDSMAL